MVTVKLIKIIGGNTMMSKEIIASVENEIMQIEKLLSKMAKDENYYMLNDRLIETKKKLWKIKNS